jgi:hypothetical protein
MRERERRRRRIERLIELGRRLADASDPLGLEARARLAVTSGLSPEGIELALTRHLETHPTEAEIEALLGPREVATEGAPSRCHIVIAANVCTSALRAIAVGLAAAPDVRVRPSSRDPALAEILVRELERDERFRSAGGSIALAPDVAQAAAGDELHVYGSDQTIEALRAAAAPGLVVRGHGTGFGLAVVGEESDVRDAARALAADVIPFDQRGCLSPRIALVEGAPDRAAALWEALHEALGRAAIPRGPLAEDTLAEIAMYRTSMEAIGAFREGPWHAVGLDPSPRALLLPPAARVVHVAAADAAGVAALLEPLSPFIAAIGASSERGALARAASSKAPGARLSRLGAMQTPPLDGPVDLRSNP